jgi:hypothetical protein
LLTSTLVCDLLSLNIDGCDHEVVGIELKAALDLLGVLITTEYGLLDLDA